ncbi:hypothetical protein [Marinobacter sp. NFXS9]|uniref:hypothetical protein n=1 Tax=Marinobacter sp. NFXS9 TaxID=2818433 RepID=UPI0032DFEED5
MNFLKEDLISEYDFAIFGLGYESRSINIFQKKEFTVTETIYAVGYDYFTEEFSYQSNKTFFKNNDCKIEEVSDEDFKKTIENIVSEFSDANTPVKVIIDITVMSRHRIARAIWTCLTLLPKGSVISIKYTISNFVPPPTITPPVSEIGAIINELEGSPGSIGFPPKLLISLGYEQGKALGAANYIDPGEIIAFVPKSKIGEFGSFVFDKNADLLKSVSPENIFDYNVHFPYSTYINLKSICLTLIKDSRPILLPLGPKIISAISVFLGYELYPNLPVWRVSSKENEQPVDRTASDHTIAFSVKN